MLENCEFYIEPRGSGKSTSLYDYMEKVYKGFKCCLITLRTNDRSYISQHFNANHIISKRFDYIFIDEYLHFDDKNIKKCNDILPFLTKNIIIRTSASRLVKKELLEAISFGRSKGICSYLDITNPDVNYLLNNLITHPKTRVISEVERSKQNLSKEEFKLFSGELFK